VKAAKQWASPYWAPSCAKISFAVAQEEEQREFARTPVEADLASASDQNTACGLILACRIRPFKGTVSRKIWRDVGMGP
jgi:hypothetical protein